MEKTSTKRRTFIKTLIFAAISLPLLGKFLVPRLERSKQLLKIKKTGIPGNGALVFREKQIAVIRQGKEVNAFETACTHLGCTVNATSEGFTCPCHGSVFDTSGQVLQGPADRPLLRLTVKEGGDYIVILS